jgi:hypothetical protein
MARRIRTERPAPDGAAVLAAVRARLEARAARFPESFKAADGGVFVAPYRHQLAELHAGQPIVVPARWLPEEAWPERVGLVQVDADGNVTPTGSVP